MKALDKLIQIARGLNIFVKKDRLSGLGVVREKKPITILGKKEVRTVARSSQTQYSIQQILVPPFIEKIVEKDFTPNDEAIFSYLEVSVIVNGVDTIVIERMDDIGHRKVEDVWQVIATLPVRDNTVIAFNDYNVEASHMYHYRVYGMRGNSRTGYSNIVSAKVTGHLDAPQGLSNIQIETEGNNIILSWTNLETRPNYVEVYADTNSYFVPTSGTLVWRGNANSCVFQPQPNTGYYFKIIQRLNNGYYSNVYPQQGVYGPYYVMGDAWGKAEDDTPAHQGSMSILHPEETDIPCPYIVELDPFEEESEPVRVWINNPLNTNPDVLGSGTYYEVVNKQSLNVDRNVKNVYNVSGTLLFDGDNNIIRRTDGYVALDLVNGLLGESIQVAAGSISDGAVLGTENINPTFEDIDGDGYPDGWIVVTSGGVAFEMVDSLDYGGKWTPKFSWSMGTSGTGEIISNFIPIGAVGYQVKRMVASYLNFVPQGAELKLQIECWDKNKENLLEVIDKYTATSSLNTEIKEEYDPNTESSAGTRYVRVKMAISVASGTGSGYLFLNYFRLFPKIYSLDLEFDKSLDLNGQRIVNLSDPINDYDAATKHYVDINASGGGGTGMPEYIYIKATGQSPGNLTLSGTNWDTSKALIKTIRIVTSSQSYNIELYHNHLFDDSSDIPYIVVGSGLSGNYDIHLDYLYVNEDGNNSVYLKYTDNDGGTHTADFYIQAYKVA